MVRADRPESVATVLGGDIVEAYIKSRRVDTERVFEHLAAHSASPDTPITEPHLSAARTIRRLCEHYGDVRAAPAFDDIRIVPASAGNVPAEWVLRDDGSPLR